MVLVDSMAPRPERSPSATPTPALVYRGIETGLDPEPQPADACMRGQIPCAAVCLPCSRLFALT